MLTRFMDCQEKYAKMLVYSTMVSNIGIKFGYVGFLGHLLHEIISDMGFFFTCITVFSVQFLGRIMHSKSSQWH